MYSRIYIYTKCANNLFTYIAGKHTIFGKVVGGLPVLSDMEKIQTDSKDKPLENITIKEVVVFVNPYKVYICIYMTVF